LTEARAFARASVFSRTEAPMPEPFEAWFMRFEAEFLRRSGLPWREVAGEPGPLLDCHAGGLSPGDTAADQLAWLGLPEVTGPPNPSADRVGTQATG
jgi:hypothetical protein